ncbi:hypothetical protein TRAPUB_12743, partial [Trametes pubescens]
GIPASDIALLTLAEILREMPLVERRPACESPAANGAVLLALLKILPDIGSELCVVKRSPCASAQRNDTPLARMAPPRSGQDPRE